MNNEYKHTKYPLMEKQDPNPKQNLLAFFLYDLYDILHYKYLDCILEELYILMLVHYINFQLL